MRLLRARLGVNPESPPPSSDYEPYFPTLPLVGKESSTDSIHGGLLFAGAKEEAVLGPPNPSRRLRRRRRDRLPGAPRHGQERRRGPHLDHLPLLPLLRRLRAAGRARRPRRRVLCRRRPRRRVICHRRRRRRRRRRRGDPAMRGAVGEGGRGSVRQGFRQGPRPRLRSGKGGKIPDATFGQPQGPAVASILRSMESSHYYAENNVDMARRRGFQVVMTTTLSSDVPVGYFSWAEYDIMAPMQPKTEAALAAAFISNCGARNFRLQALQMLEQMGIKIDSYGACHRNRDGRVDKVETLKKYKFSLAFENSNEDDYVTEKFFQSLVAGSVPVVVGAPNIQDFAPAPGSILHIKELSDVSSIAQTMKNLAADPDAYNHTMRWKFEGPSDSFKALVDMAAVHSSCRLCIHLATKIREKEEKTAKFQNRPCSCSSNKGTVYHLFVRERGRFEMESIFLRSDKLTVEALEFAVLEKFRSLNHVPIWKTERPASIRGDDELKMYRIYPVGLTQRQALYSFKFKDDADLERYIKINPCAKLEAIFV